MQEGEAVNIQFRQKSRVRAVAAIMSGALLVSSLPVFGDPPPWAPAHGWRKQHDPYYQGYTGRRWDNDYGVVDGRCDASAVLGTAGAVVGGAAGSRMGGGDGKVIATILGAAIGAVVGAKIGRDLEDVDRACIGHSLELVGDARVVNWVNPNTGVAYTLTPLRSDGRSCRDFKLAANYRGRSNSRTSTACRNASDDWQFKQ